MRLYTLDIEKLVDNSVETVDLYRKNRWKRLSTKKLYVDKDKN